MPEIRTLHFKCHTVCYLLNLTYLGICIYLERRKLTSWPNNCSLTIIERAETLISDLETRKFTCLSRTSETSTKLTVWYAMWVGVIIRPHWWRWGRRVSNKGIECRTKWNYIRCSWYHLLHPMCSSEIVANQVSR